MTILTRQERERLVLEFYYNQGKTYREISKEARISPCDIGVILNRIVEEKKTEGLKEEEQDNTDSEKNHNQEQQPDLPLSSQAYKLFSEGKTPLGVAIELNLRESEPTKLYRVLEAKAVTQLSMVYEETKGDVESFLKLYRLSKANGISVSHLNSLLAIANNNLPAIEERYKKIRNDVSMLQIRKQTLERNLYQLNNQIATTTNILNSFRMSCSRERREIENLQNEKVRLDALVTGFKSSNEEYLKIKETAEEKLKDVLNDRKILLRIAIASVIESLRRNTELYNLLIYDNSNNTTISYGSNYPLLMLSGSQQQQQQLFTNTYIALILEEAEKLYNKL